MEYSTVVKLNDKLIFFSHLDYGIRIMKRLFEKSQFLQLSFA
jgi:hypothetical protein